MITDDSLKLAFSARLNSALDALGFAPKGQGRQVALAKVMNVSQKGARKWLEGEAIPGMTNLTRLAIIADVSLEWLATGRGPRTVPPAAPPSYEMPPDGQLRERNEHHVADKTTTPDQPPTAQQGMPNDIADALSHLALLIRAHCS